MKKVVSIFGAVLGLAIAVVGFLVMRGEIFKGVFAETTTADSAVTTVFQTSATDKFGPSSSFYDTGYTVFGADFYTYVNNNTAMAAEAAGATAINTKTAAINSGLAVANAAAAAENAAVAANNANAVSKNIIAAAKLQQSLVGLILLCFGSVSCLAFLMLWPSGKKGKKPAAVLIDPLPANADSAPAEEVEQPVSADEAEEPAILSDTQESADGPVTKKEIEKEKQPETDL